jgi:hypothetical protein
MKRTVLEGSRQGWLSSWERTAGFDHLSRGDGWSGSDHDIDFLVRVGSVDGRTSRALFARTPNNHPKPDPPPSFLLFTYRLPACVSPLLHPRSLSRYCCSCSRVLPRPSDLHTEPPGSNYFRQAPSALNSLLYYKRVILRDPPAAAHAPSHYQHSHEPDRLVPGRCITVSLFSRHEPDPVLLRRCPSARPAPTRPVNQPPQWHLYRNKTSYDPYQRPFILQLDPRHGLHPCIRRFQGLDGCQ